MSRRKLVVREVKGFYLRLTLPKKREAVRREIFSALGLLKNYAANGGAPRLDDILEELAKGEGILSGTFEKCLKLLRAGHIDEIGACFANKTGAENTEEFTSLLSMWDSIDPSKLVSVIEAQRNAMREEMTTNMIRKTERMSDLLYIPTIASVLIVFVNFIYIGYYLQQKEMLTQIFF
ncbi:MAG: hypothetical protein LBN34_09785 [Clostridiales Family XIII bacterium]|jgi:hypothetical protein|nr:hypothetical protein [Clostridiales Family XIII bacterium]